MATGNRWGFSFEDRSNRPRLDIPLSRVELIQDIFSVIGLFLMIAALLFRPPGTSPGIYVFLPSATFICLLITFVRRYPHRHNYLVTITQENADYHHRRAREFLGWLKTEVVWLLLGMQAAIEPLAITTETTAVAAFLLVFVPGFIVINGTLLYYIFKMAPAREGTGT